LTGSASWGDEEGRSRKREQQRRVRVSSPDSKKRLTPASPISPKGYRHDEVDQRKEPKFTLIKIGSSSVTAEGRRKI
jgi:hypothetical protein